MLSPEHVNLDDLELKYRASDDQHALALIQRVKIAEQQVEDMLEILPCSDSLNKRIKDIDKLLN